IEMLEIYNAGDEVEESRNMHFLDESRNPEYPDDVLVYPVKDGNNPEGCWVRIEGLAEDHIFGTLLNEPEQDFGCHEGDKIPFYVKHN
ncbi:SseB family protein, partial [Streptococcus anginosus]|nr:SseB family protein [Streptococcus anginosus]